MLILSGLWNTDDSFHHVPSAILRNGVVGVHKTVYVHHPTPITVPPD